jgi:hypothetical protein
VHDGDQLDATARLEETALNLNARLVDDPCLLEGWPATGPVTARVALAEPASRPPVRDPEADSDTEALTAIMSRYEDVRDQIISGVEPDDAPVDLGPGPARPRQGHRASGVAPATASRRRQAVLQAVLSWLGTDVGHSVPAPYLPY